MVAAEEVTMPTVEQEVEHEKPKARGKAKAKGKAKGKGKAKAKGKARAASANAEPGSPSKPKPMSFKAKIMAEVGERDIDEVIAEVRKEVVELQVAVVAVQGEENQFDEEIAAAKKAYETATSKVEDAKHQEALAFEKVKVTREAALEARQGTGSAQVGRGDVEKTIVLLELESECKTKVKDMQDAKEASVAAAEAAKKALEDAKKKEKEASSAAKTAVAEVRSKEHEALQAIHDRQLAVYDQNKSAKGQGKGLAKELNAEVKELEKRRQEREKARAQKVKEAMGLGKKRAGEEGAGKSPAKAARVEDVD